jgi:hypothetical protein
MLTEGGLVALPAGWPLDEFLLTQSGAAEVEARLRLVSDRKRCGVEKARADDASCPIVLDDRTYTARINGRPVAFTYTEFELLRYLLRHPDRVLTRTRLLTDVWGYDYIGTSRTVDSHISRIRTNSASSAHSASARSAKSDSVPACIPRDCTRTVLAHRMLSTSPLTGACPQDKSRTDTTIYTIIRTDSPPSMSRASVSKLD